MNVFLFLVFLITIAYLGIITAYSIGWFISKYYFISGNSLSTRVSIIIPARNEEDNIENCLNDIIKQNYPKELFEIIVINDESTDNTPEKVRRIINDNKQNSIRLLNSESQNTGIAYKKLSLSIGIKESSGDLIITTDADCRFGDNWLSTIVDYYETNNPKMLIGPVCFNNDNTIFTRLQSLEFMSLIGTTAGSANIKLPIMCNGANIAFEKEAFLAVNGYGTDDKYASGDDMFLMIRINDKYPGKVHFIKNSDAIVYTKAKESFREFISQRKRWVSKTKGYKSLSIMITAIVVYLFNLTMLLLLIMSFDIRGTMYDVRLMFLSLFVCKCLIDFPILSGVSSFMNRRHLMKYFIPLEFINIFYVTIIGIIGSIGKYRWKGRTVN